MIQKIITLIDFIKMINSEYTMFTKIDTINLDLKIYKTILHFLNIHLKTNQFHLNFLLEMKKVLNQYYIFIIFNQKFKSNDFISVKLSSIYIQINFFFFDHIIADLQNMNENISINNPFYFLLTILSYLKSIKPNFSFNTRYFSINLNYKQVYHFQYSLKINHFEYFSKLEMKVIFTYC